MARASLCFVVGAVLLYLPSITVSQTPAAKDSVGQALELDRVGGGKLSSGHEFSFRSYVRPDGTNGILIMAHFTSSQDAQHQITEWLSRAQKVTNREHDIKRGQQIISDRIEGLMPDPKSGKPEFIIIRRDGLDCYLIQSFSSKVAMQVEELIRHN